MIAVATEGSKHVAEHAAWLALQLLLGTVGFAAAGVVFSAALLRSRSRDALLGALLFPVVVPVLMAGARGTTLLLDAEVPDLEATVDELETQLSDLLAPRDPHDGDDIVLEVKSGEGGEESALFAGDLARMYIRYAERHGWTVAVLDETFSDLGGYKDATLSIRSKGDAADGVWSRLKFEGGVHRVQRVPVTESQGRVHTSAAGVLVYPEPEEVEEVHIDESDLRIDVYRSSGKGGQGVNTTDSAVRITHLPTGIVVTCQNERSQLQNKARAMQVLAARLQALAEEQVQADASADRASQIRTVDRSERIRTYNFPENRIADHRINFKAHNLDQVLDGDLDALFDALAAADKQSRLQQA